MQRLRLRDAADVAAAVGEVRAAMREHGKTIGSWWVSDRSMPVDLHELLLGHGLRIVAGDPSSRDSH